MLTITQGSPTRNKKIQNQNNLNTHESTPWNKFYRCRGAFESSGLWPTILLWWLNILGPSCVKLRPDCLNERLPSLRWSLFLQCFALEICLVIPFTFVQQFSLFTKEVWTTVQGCSDIPKRGFVGKRMLQDNALDIHISFNKDGNEAEEVVWIW